MGCERFRIGLGSTVYKASGEATREQGAEGGQKPAASAWILRHGCLQVTVKRSQTGGKIQTR